MNPLMEKVGEKRESKKIGVAGKTGIEASPG